METFDLEGIPEQYRDNVADTVRNQLSLQQDLVTFRKNAEDYYSHLLGILVRKQGDYGPANIALAPGGPLNGLLVRMNDKLQRLINLTYSESKPNNEAIRDSYEDLANYCVIALMVMDGKWEGVPDGKA